MRRQPEGEAVYEKGILRSLTPLYLEHQSVRLTLEVGPARLSWESAEPVNERRGVAAARQEMDTGATFCNILMSW